MLQFIVRTFGSDIDLNFLFVQDNAYPHVALNMIKWLGKEEREGLLMSAQSPDIHPIDERCFILDLLQR